VALPRASALGCSLGALTWRALLAFPAGSGSTAALSTARIAIAAAAEAADEPDEADAVDADASAADGDDDSDSDSDGDDDDDSDGDGDTNVAADVDVAEDTDASAVDVDADRDVDVAAGLDVEGIDGVCIARISADVAVGASSANPPCTSASDPSISIRLMIFELMTPTTLRLLLQGSVNTHSR
jgi:hypothetical protein